MQCTLFTRLILGGTGCWIFVYNLFPNLEKNGESMCKATKTTLILSSNLWTVGWAREHLGIQLSYSLQ